VGKGKKVVIGYRYYLGIHIGLGRGPIDELVEIKVGDRTAWSGSVTGNQTIQINAPNLFGGDKGEGGIQGSLDVMMGAPTQAVNTRLAAMLGGLVPAFRGIATLFFDGLVCSLNPYPKSWSIRRRRVLQGWDGGTWYAAKAVVWLAGNSIKAMNPSHILYECLTNRDWGRGLDRSRLDDASFTAAADKLHAEGFGLCLRWTRQDALSSFVSAVLNHIGATLFVSRTTGKLVLRLIRDDYNPDTLPLFTYDSGLLGIDDDDAAASDKAINEQVVKYRDPVTNDDKRVRVQNLAAIQATRNVFSQTTEYVGIPTADLALRVAQRDLRSYSGITKRFRVRLDRRGYAVEPGGVFRISDPARGIAAMVLRAGRIEGGVLTRGEITITAVQDVFGLPATSYVDVQPSGWTPPDTTPRAVVNRVLMEVPYRELVRLVDPANFALIPATVGYLGVLANKPTSLSMSFVTSTRVGSSGALVDRDTGDFCPNGLLPAAIGPAATTASVIGGVDLDQVNIGGAALIDTEIVRVVAFNANSGALTLARGCADTVPTAHASGARIWFCEDVLGGDTTEYSVGVTVQAKLLTITSAGPLDPALAPTDSLVMAQRHYRPYPPGNLKINGTAYPDLISGALSLSWSHRDRTLQADQLVDTTQGDIGPETGVTYTLRLYGEANTLLRTESGLTATSYTYQLADEITDSALSGAGSGALAFLCRFDGGNGSAIFTDEAGHAMTATGNAQISTAQNRFGGASGVFDGTGDWIDVAASTDFSWGRGDFCIEGWAYLAANAGRNKTLIDMRTADSQAAIWLYITSGQKLALYVNGAARITDGTNFPLTTWTHWAVTRALGVTRLFRGGVLVGSWTDASDYPARPLRLGARYAVASGIYDEWVGHIDSVRIVTGTAVYTVAYTPPLAEFPTSGQLGDPFFANVGLLLHLDGANAGTTFVDVKGKSVTRSGVTTTTAQWKFGNAAAVFNGNADYLNLSSHVDFQFGTGDFTIEGWGYLLSYTIAANISRALVDMRTADSQIAVVLDIAADTGLFRLYVNGAYTIISTEPFPLNAWCHWAVCRSGGITRLYLNGVVQGSVADTNDYPARPLRIGGRYASPTSRSWDGYLDELRVTKGVARYTGPFAPPIDSFPDSGLYRLNAQLRIELESVRGGLASAQRHNVTIAR